jgi:hypothetical protein
MAVRKKQTDFSALEQEAIKCEMIAGLQRAIDRNYRRIVQAAKSDWERLFAGKDPSDACVSVRINSPVSEASTTAVPRAGYLSKPASLPAAKTKPRLA